MRLWDLIARVQYLVQGEALVAEQAGDGLVCVAEWILRWVSREKLGG
jgi:hypothetical protein